MDDQTSHDPVETQMISERELSHAVREVAMLADVTVSLWGAERTDTAIMDKVKADAGATGNVGRVIKNMLAGVDGQLKETRSAFAAVRAIHYGLTLPWVSDPHAQRSSGPRLLPNMLFERYMTEVSRAKRVAMVSLDKFIDGYPDAVIQARANLAGLADAMYPSPEEVRGMFRVSFDFEPIPAGASFKGLPDHLMDKLSARLAAKQERMVGAAMSAMWTEVRERLGHLTARLAVPDGIFRETTIENTRELANLLPAWNLTGDPRAAEVASDITRMLGGVTATTMRKHATTRQDVAEQATALGEKLSGWGL